ncbi:MAG: hypothetical protein M3381_01720 [Actinomycetota bacterium]|nr:hypothetical protein [Actinomycetota bacterium]
MTLIGRHTYDVVVIGGGSAGASLAAVAAVLGRLAHASPSRSLSVSGG